MSTKDKGGFAMDRFFRGMTAGIIAAVPMNLWSFLSFHYLDWSERRFADWGTILLLGSPPNNALELMLGLFLQLVWAGFLGIVYAYLIKNFTSQGYLIKGAYFGILSGFFTYSAPVLLGSSYLEQTSAATAASQIVGGLVWGITAAVSLRILDKRVRS